MDVFLADSRDSRLKRFLQSEPLHLGLPLSWGGDARTAQRGRRLVVAPSGVDSVNKVGTLDAGVVAFATGRMLCSFLIVRLLTKRTPN